jgi:hypothetical protein
MKKILMGVAGIALFGAMVAVPVFAATGSAGNAASNVAQAPGAAFRAPTYQVAYVDSFFGPVVCTGVHIETGPTTDMTGMQSNDTFMCTSASGTLTNVTPGEVLSLGTFGGWLSDYFQQQNRNVYATSFNGVVWPNGMTYTATAVYTPAR